MSQISLTNQERRKALQAFGYTEREAEFLCTAALQGGYFLRRHYDQFLGRPDGGTATQLIERALANGHIRAFTYRPRTTIYHLCTRPFYQALGQGDNRNRRLRQPLTIKNRLMGLDFVLAHRDRDYLATEQEKLDYFTGVLNIPVSVLPAKVYRSAKSYDATARYFVDKYPIFLHRAPLSGRPAVVSFCFVNEGLTTVSRFETYLAQYHRLLASLPEFGFVYVSSTALHFAAAKRTFERFLAPARTGANGAPIDPEMRLMLAHFEARRRYESGELDDFDREKLIRLRRDREHFSGPKSEALYQRWKTGGDEALLEVPQREEARRRRIHGTFSTCLLEQNYDLFGNLTGV
jgi:hypothetical protein